MTTAYEAAAPTGVPAYPFVPYERLDFDPRLAELLVNCPVLRVRLPYGGIAWLVTRHADAKMVLADSRFSRAAMVGKDAPRSSSRIEEPSMLNMDPPEHTRLRGLVAKAFTGRRVEMLRPRVQQIADDLLDTMVAAGPPADLAESLALPLAGTVICELLGVPFDDHHQFRIWTDGALMVSGAPEQATEAMGQLIGYMAGLITRRRAEPSDDLLGALIAARDNEDQLSEAELLMLAATLLGAGFASTANQIGNFVYTLLTHPGYWQDLVADPDLVPAAVEELSRIIPIFAGGSQTRIVTEDLELGGQTIRAGEAVVVIHEAANRDPEVFDHPDVIDFHRDTNPHITFSHGAHHCLGAHLARIELQVALTTLLRRLPGLRLAVPADQIPWRTGERVRGVSALPVKW
jgi:cytochrome P450